MPRYATASTVMVPVMPLPAATEIDPPLPILRSCFSSDRQRVGKILDELKALGITPPKNVAEGFRRALEFRAEANGTKPDPTAAEVVSAGGRVLTRSEVDSRSLRVEAEDTYIATAHALRTAAPALVDNLREALEVTLASQRDGSLDVEHPELRARYDRIHAVGKLLRRHTGDVAMIPTTDWWRFGAPERVWKWRLEEAERLLHTHPRPAVAKNVSVDVIDGGPLVDGVIHQRTQVRGVPLTLDVIAEHADEWGPTVVLADELLVTADRIEQEQQA